MDARCSKPLLLFLWLAFSSLVGVSFGFKKPGPLKSELEAKIKDLELEVTALRAGDSNLTCSRVINETQEKYARYFDKFHECKLMFQSFKVVSWFMGKEVWRLKENLTILEENDAAKNFKIDSDRKALSRTNRDMDKLGKEHISLQKNLEELKSTHRKVETDLSKCEKTKQHAEFMRQGSELAIKEYDNDEHRMKKEIADLTKELEEVIDGAEVYKMYFTVCVIIMFCLVVVQLYFYGKQWFEDYQERLREEKAAQKREKREIKSRGRKPKIQ